MAELLLLLLSLLGGRVIRVLSTRLGPQWVCCGGREGEFLIKVESRSFLGICTSVLGGLLVKPASAFPLQSHKQEGLGSLTFGWC